MNHSDMSAKNENLRKKVEELREEESRLTAQITKIKAEVREVEADFKEWESLRNIWLYRSLDKQKNEERTLKRNIENLSYELDSKRRFVRELEEKITSLTEELETKERELTKLNHMVEDLAAEKEAYRQNKLENAQICKEVYLFSALITFQLEENKIRYDDMKFKLAIQEENLAQIKTQIEGTNNILKEKQNEILSLEKRISKLNDELAQNQVELERYEHRFIEKE